MSEPIYSEQEDYILQPKTIDKLELMMKQQQILNERIQLKYNLPEFTELDYWLRQNSLAMFSELNEMMEGFNWKHWKRKKQLYIEYLRHEAIDIFHFVMTYFLLLGMSADDVFDYYMKKNQENHDRQDGKVKGREDYE